MIERAAERDSLIYFLAKLQSSVNITSRGSAKGILQCESTPGVGTEFLIEIPVRHSSEARANASASVAAT